MLVLSIDRPVTGVMFSFKNCPAVTDLLMCRKYCIQRKKTLNLYYYLHSPPPFFFGGGRGVETEKYTNLSVLETNAAKKTDGIGLPPPLAQNGGRLEITGDDDVAK